ncbi:hypothetical protein HN865_01125 [Candidatus Woesearchaeota archaeon]|jgi:hypothetical protein|nr:hypothetical protein [Candidatus Woesearchaeota archaeon]MBT7237438.1 hypothetical protein [Candidatus Woesearchaeota archaeon]
MYVGPLTLERFEEYFNQERLGELYLPNGECLIEPAERKVPTRYGPFGVLLADVYKSITGWDETGETKLSLNNILGVIAFGDSVRIPNAKKRKKYYVVGPEIHTDKPETIYPTHLDLLLVAKEGIKYSPEDIEPERYEENPAEIELGGIRTHITTYQELEHSCFREGIEEYGNPAMNGVVIFSGEKDLDHLLFKDEVNQLTIGWRENSGDRILDGQIDF